jgi:excisionase family DNA binding protein
MTTMTVDPLWGVEEVSAFLRVPVPTLYQWRHRHLGPPAYKVGRHLRYDPGEVRAWLSGQEHGHASR